MATQTYQTILTERNEAVCTIQLNKPPLNILDSAMIEDVLSALREVEQDPSLRVLVFRSAGEKAFCAGVSVHDHTPDRVREVVSRFGDIFRLLARTEKITVAAVQGYCLGGGMELAMMCDLAVAAENAQLGQPEIKLGQLPPVGIILLPFLIGYRKAAELLFTGKTISAQEAQSLGLVNRVVPSSGLSQAVEELLREMTSLSGAALRLSKSLLRRVSGLDFERALRESEDFFFNTVVQTDDAKEGVFAFIEKRAPRWTHR